VRPSHANRYSPSETHIIGSRSAHLVSNRAAGLPRLTEGAQPPRPNQARGVRHWRMPRPQGRRAVRWYAWCGSGSKRGCSILRIWDEISRASELIGAMAAIISGCQYAAEKLSSCWLRRANPEYASILLCSRTVALVNHQKKRKCE
jgi:hypothetical protein